MVSITVSVSDEIGDRMDRFPWVNWSEVVRTCLVKQEIFEEFMRSGKIGKNDWKFCKNIDWHPVDWLPIKKSYVRELERIGKERTVRVRSVKDLFG